MGEARSPQEGRLLGGVRILDFTFQGAGPYATMLLGLLGAEIIKVESATRPDPTRGRENRPYLRSLLFDDVNLDKRSITLNMKTDGGRRLARSLVGRCSAVVDCFRPGVMQRWGLDHDSLRPEHPGLVSASLSATGSTGPLARLPGYAGIFNAMGGLGVLTGYCDGPPTELRTSIDMRVGALFATAVIGALVRARRSGRGEFVDFSAVEAVTMLCGEYLLSESMGAPVAPLRVGNRDDEHAPTGIYEGADGRWIAIGVQSDEEWQTLAGFLAADGEPVPEGVDHADGRLARTEELDGLLAIWVARRETGEVLDTLLGAGIAAGPVMDAQDLAKDPDIALDGFLGSVLSGATGEVVKACGAPWKINGVRPNVTSTPGLGEDTPTVLGELLDLGPEQLASLRAESVLL